METIKLFIKSLITNIFFTAILFISAGSFNFLQGWIFLSVNILTSFMNVFSIRKNTELIKERSKSGEGAKSWDKMLLAFSALMYLIMIIVAGFDSGRFLWSFNISWVMCLVGIIILLSGQMIFLTARNQNNFFSSIVRIQKDRGHTVCDQGLYKIIRHPGYLGMMLSLAAIPLILTSLWSVIPTLIAIILLLVRTSLEDKTLKKELDGYADYTLKTRFKLIPLIW